MKTQSLLLFALMVLAESATVSSGAGTTINYSGKEGSLQQVIDKAPPGSTIVCNIEKQLEFNQPLKIEKALTLKGLNARLPGKLGKTSLIEVTAENVSLTDLELHGNYDSVDQDNRAALINISKGGFRVERCKFYDSSKDGVQITPVNGAREDLVGGIVRAIEAFRMGRDAVSISGGVEGRKIRNVTVENVSLKKGYFRGSVEVSDGTDNIIVRNVYAEDCVYAIDVQDHRKECASNTNITIENVTAVNCKHVIRTANSPRGHAKLTLLNFTAKNCESPVSLSNTEGISVDGLTILNHQSEKYPPITLKNCQGVLLKNVTSESATFADQPVKAEACTDVNIQGLTKKKPSTH